MFGNYNRSTVGNSTGAAKNVTRLPRADGTYIHDDVGVAPVGIKLGHLIPLKWRFKDGKLTISMSVDIL